MSAWKDPWLRNPKHGAFYILSVLNCLRHLRRYDELFCDCSILWICRCAIQPKQITAQTEMWGRSIQKRTTDSADRPRVRLVGSFVADPALICPVCPLRKRNIWKRHKKRPLKSLLRAPWACYDHKPSVSHHVSSSLCLAAEADQPQKLVCRIVGVKLAALVSYAQCQNGPSAHATNEDVVNPASDHGTENRKFSGITDGLKWNQNSFHSITYLLAEMQLAGVGSRSVCFSGKAGNQHRTFKSCVPCSADLVISRRLLKLEKTGQ